MSGEGQTPGDQAAADDEATAQAALIIKRNAERRRRRHLYDLLVLLTGLACSLIVILAFFVILQDRHRIDELTSQGKVDTDTQICWLWLNYYINDSRSQAESADRNLSVLVARDIIGLSPPTQEDYIRAGGDLVAAETRSNQAIARLAVWLRQGTPLPCPINPSPLVLPGDIVLPPSGITGTTEPLPL
jgi:hypothetical protein